ncbi:MAG: GNAT family N-acetyltransferase [Calditrichaeota bacterium]|nr:MAG: GNAT family N-acetyltransferase [Calditrichota bacterium]
MNLTPIKKNQFSRWKNYRNTVFNSLSDKFHEIEMEKILNDIDWFCYFLTNDNNQIIGLAELSSRNIVDGCLSSPVAYIEGLYIEEQYRGKGAGKETMRAIHRWCKQRGFTELAADTELENLGAQKFFNAVGFNETYRVVEFCTKVENT